MDQASEKWHNWRGKGIGSSDAPVIMGFEEYLTKHQLCLEKMGVWKRPPGGFAANLGHHFEQHARSSFNIMNDVDVVPECAEHVEFKYLRASLDGADLKNRVFVEIKYMGEENFEWCKENKRPLEKHHPQTQHQFLVTGFERGVYIPYTLTEDKKKIKSIEYIPMTPDREYIESKLFPAEQLFWDCVTTQTPPPIGDNDEKIIKDKLAIKAAEDYLALKKEIDEKTKLLDHHRELLISIVDHPVVNFGNKLKVIRSIRKGNIDYSEIPELKKINLEQFRKPAIQTTSIKEIK